MFLPQTLSQEGTTIQNSEEEGEQQNEILLGRLDGLENDPRDILLFQMDKEIGDIGAALPMFTQEEKKVMKDFWHKWNFTSWESLSEELSDFQDAKKFIYETGCVTPAMNRQVKMSHPGHIMVATLKA